MNSKEEYEEALETLYNLMQIENKSIEETRIFLSLSKLVEEYEDLHFPI